MKAEQGIVEGIEIGAEPTEEIDIRELGLRRFIDLIVIINPIFLYKYLVNNISSDYILIFL